MVEHSFLLEFARTYGLREAVVITELCKRIRNDDGSQKFFYFDGMKEQFSYFSVKQLRSALNNLASFGCLIKTDERSGKNNFKRRTRYEIRNEILVFYRKTAKENLYNQFMKTAGY